MPSDDRLQELRRQRALVQEQLNWLDREIAALTGQQNAPHPIPPAVPPSPAAQPVTADEAESILEQYRGETGSAAAAAKRGCLIAFFFVLGVFALAVVALYFYAAHRHATPR